MKRAFTLVELMVVIGIMAMLGGISVGGYRAVVRGMEERAALEAGSSIVRLAYQRALIDRRLTAIRFWNETVRSETDIDTAMVVGKAIAIRRYGRISRIEGQALVDEFGDLERSYPTNDVNNAAGTSADRVLYNLSDPQNVKWSAVADAVEQVDRPDLLLTSGSTPQIRRFGFIKTGKGDANWKVGDVYGLEFATLTLPKGYIFEGNFSTSTEDPVREIGVMSFDEHGNVKSGSKQIEIRQLRPGDGGSLTARPVGRTEDPTQRIAN